MKITVNQELHELSQFTAPVSVADLLDWWKARPPYAVAVNEEFVPKFSYSEHLLQDGDRVEIISPVTGG